MHRDLINLTQDQLSASVYFTKLKVLGEELSNYIPICTCGKCTCGGVKALNTHYQMEYIMSFLMGLNYSFCQVRGQLLLMDPLQAINTVFSLVSQEEHKRKVGSHPTSGSNSSNSVAFTTKSDTLPRSGNGNPSGLNSTNGNNRGQKKKKR